MSKNLLFLLLLLGFSKTILAQCEFNFTAVPTTNPNEFVFQGYDANVSPFFESYTWYFSTGPVSGNPITYTIPASTYPYSICVDYSVQLSSSGPVCLSNYCMLLNTSGTFNSCFDSAFFNPMAICPLIYAPVCGCDYVTYSNDCIAIANGITQWTNGVCAGAGCNSNFTYVVSGNTVNFTSLAIGGGFVSHIYDFGDGDTSMVANPSHTYATPGTYNVCLTISDASFAGCTDIQCFTVVILGSTNTAPYPSNSNWAFYDSCTINLNVPRGGNNIIDADFLDMEGNTPFTISNVASCGIGETYTYDAASGNITVSVPIGTSVGIANACFEICDAVGACQTYDYCINVLWGTDVTESNFWNDLAIYQTKKSIEITNLPNVKNFIQVFNASGQLISNLQTLEKNTSLNLPETQGLFFIHIFNKQSSYKTKLIIF